MKNIIVILLIFLGCTNLDAQETIARFKYEDAEKAFVAENYQECIDNLNEAEKLLGKTAPNILHLKILAQYKLIEKDPYGDFELLETLHIGCATYLRDYDIAGLEEKYRDVYEVQESIKDYPKTLEAYTAAIERQKQEIRTIFENYINAIGGRKALDQVKSLYIKGQQTIDKETTPFEERIMQEKKSHTSYYYPRNKNAYGNAKKKKSELLNRTITTEDGTFIVDNDGKKTIPENNGITPIKNRLFPEMYLTDQLDNPDFGFDLSKEGNLVTINITYGRDGLGKPYSSSRTYDASTYLLKSVTTLNYHSNDPLSELKPNGYRHIILEDYKRIEDVYRPFRKIVFMKQDYKVQKNAIKEEYTIEEILINQNVVPSDFEP